MKKICKALTFFLFLFIIGDITSYGLELKETSGLYLYDHKYIEVPVKLIYDKDIKDGWSFDEENNNWYYYVKNYRITNSIRSIDGIIYYFNKEGKMFDESTNEYKNYFNLLNSIYNAKKNNDLEFSINTENMSEEDIYDLMFNYNYLFLLRNFDLNYNGLKLNNNKITIENYDVFLEDEIQKLLKKLSGIETLTDKEKVKQINKVIVDTFDYDYSEKNHGGALEAFKNDYKFICSGYADTFDKLCEIYNVKSEVITGNTPWGLHAWNRVFINGSWKYIDCTWNDSENTDEWLLKTKSEFDKTHYSY